MTTRWGFRAADVALVACWRHRQPPPEEFGWSGVALPMLHWRFAPLWSALIVGSLPPWRTPGFLMSGSKQGSWSLGPFFLGVVAISVILTPMFNAARGSLLVAALFHAQMNGPSWPDAQPWDMLGFVAVAVVVVWFNRHTMLTRGTGATDVLMAATDSPKAWMSRRRSYWHRMPAQRVAVRVQATQGGCEP